MVSRICALVTLIAVSSLSFASSQNVFLPFESTQPPFTMYRIYAAIIPGVDTSYTPSYQIGPWTFYGRPGLPVLQFGEAELYNSNYIPQGVAEVGGNYWVTAIEANGSGEVMLMYLNSAWLTVEQYNYLPTAYKSQGGYSTPIAGLNESDAVIQAYSGQNMVHFTDGEFNQVTLENENYFSGLVALPSKNKYAALLLNRMPGGKIYYMEFSSLNGASALYELPTGFTGSPELVEGFEGAIIYGLYKEMSSVTTVNINEDNQMELTVYNLPVGDSSDPFLVRKCGSSLNFVNSQYLINFSSFPYSNWTKEISMTGLGNPTATSATCFLKSMQVTYNNAEGSSYFFEFYLDVDASLGFSGEPVYVRNGSTLDMIGDGNFIGSFEQSSEEFLQFDSLFIEPANKKTQLDLNNTNTTLKNANN